MQNFSEHVFADGPDSLTVCISEVKKEDYGLYVWPSSILLAEYIWQERTRFRGRKILELGAGAALPGIVAAKVGGDVILTDHADLTEVFENMKASCQISNISCKVQELTWGEWDSATCSLKNQVDIVLGADVIYENTDFDDLFATVSFLLKGRPGAVFITTYEKRSGHRSVEYLMAKWGLSCTTVIDISEFVQSENISSLPSSLQLIEIVAGSPGEKSNAMVVQPSQDEVQYAELEGFLKDAYLLSNNGAKMGMVLRDEISSEDQCESSWEEDDSASEDSSDDFSSEEEEDMKKIKEKSSQKL